MRNEYDFTSARKNPYSQKLKRRISINLELSVIDYFKSMSVTCGIPYQNLINLYLMDCVTSKKKIDLSWK